MQLPRWAQFCAGICTAICTTPPRWRLFHVLLLLFQLFCCAPFGSAWLGPAEVSSAGLDRLGWAGVTPASCLPAAASLLVLSLQHPCQFVPSLLSPSALYPATWFWRKQEENWWSRQATGPRGLTLMLPTGEKQNGADFHGVLLFHLKTMRPITD